ncbi:MAG: hypothetical protein ABI462_09865 [Ignavibacteria bacterium]
MRAAIEWSYDLLNEEEKDLFRKLAVFKGGFDYEAVEDICCEGQCDPYDLTDSLLSKNFFKKENEVNEVSRFSMLELLRDYATELFDKSDEKEKIKLRHAYFYLRRAENDITAFSGADQDIVSQKWKADVENVLEALSTFLADRKYTELVNMIYALWPLFWVYNYDGELAKKIDLLLIMHTATDLSDEVIGKLHWLAGIISMEKGEYITAEYFLKHAQDYFSKTDNKRAIAWTHHLLESIDIATHPEKNKEDIMRSFEGSARMFRECGDLNGESMVTISAAAHEGRSGDYPDALKLYDDCFIIAKKLGNKALQGHTITMKAWPYIELNEYENAEQHLREGIEFFKEGRHPEGFSYCLEIMSYYFFKINKEQNAMLLLGAYKNLMSKYQLTPWPMLSSVNDYLNKKSETISDKKLTDAFEEGMKTDIFKAARLAYKIISDRDKND